MPTKNDVFFSAASCKKDIIFVGHPKQIFGPSYFVMALALIFFAFKSVKENPFYRFEGDAMILVLLKP